MTNKPAALEGHAATDALPAVVNTHEAQGGTRHLTEVEPPKWWSTQPAEPADSRAVGTAGDTSVYELINPSDFILFDAPSDEVAALAALAVGTGRFGAKRCDNGLSVIHIALFGGDGGFLERYDRTHSEAMAALAPTVVACLHSFRIGYGERTSMNDIVAYAHSFKLTDDAARGAQ